MKLFCSKCRSFFQPQDKVVKIEIEDAVIQFLYYHKDCRPKGHKVVAYDTAEKMIASLEGNYEGKKMFRKVCKSPNCNAVFVTPTRTRKFCCDDCADEYENEKSVIRMGRNRARLKIVSQNNA